MMPISISSVCRVTRSYLRQRPPVGVGTAHEEVLVVHQPHLGMEDTGTHQPVKVQISHLDGDRKR